MKTLREAYLRNGKILSQYENPRNLASISDPGYSGGIELNVNEAIIVRDWLNKFIEINEAKDAT